MISRPSAIGSEMPPISTASSASSSPGISRPRRRPAAMASADPDRQEPVEGGEPCRPWRRAVRGAAVAVSRSLLRDGEARVESSSERAGAGPVVDPGAAPLASRAARPRAAPSGGGRSSARQVERVGQVADADLTAGVGGDEGQQAQPTGSPRALKDGASRSAWSALRGRLTRGTRQSSIDSRVERSNRLLRHAFI